MKVKTMSALAGLGGALILSSSADAAFTGLQLVNVSTWMSTVANTNIRASYNAAGGPGTYEVWRLFATFDNTGVVTPGNRVNAINGLVGNPWSFSISSGSLYNRVDVGQSTTTTSGTATNVNIFDVHYNNQAGTNGTGSAGSNTLDSSRGWETWATIGLQSGTAAAPSAWTPGGEAGVNNLQNPYSSTDAAYYCTPDDTQGRAIALTNANAGGMGGTAGTFGVLLLQITVATGSEFSGTLNVNVGAAGAAPQDILGLSYTNVIPAPGALALLGLAGVVGGRRRRS